MTEQFLAIFVEKIKNVLFPLKKHLDRLPKF